ncbi:MAG: hypothetical protein ACTSWY_02680 [Promethearchaeota archaeon]
MKTRQISIKNYENLLGRISFNFAKIPKYKFYKHLGEVLSADLLVSFIFHENKDKNGTISEIEEEKELIIHSVDIAKSLDQIVKAVKQIKKLKDKQSIRNNLFISLKAEQSKNEDSSVLFKFTRKNYTDLHIEINSKKQGKVLVKTSHSIFYSSMMDFANITLELIKNLNSMGEKFEESISVRLYNIIANLPL